MTAGSLGDKVKVTNRLEASICGLPALHVAIDGPRASICVLRCNAGDLIRLKTEVGGVIGSALRFRSRERVESELSPSEPWIRHLDPTRCRSTIADVELKLPGPVCIAWTVILPWGEKVLSHSGQYSQRG